MKVMRTIGVAVLATFMAAGLSGCSYNKFVGQEEAIKTQWGQVENQLQRRNDLIPNLVETVKGIAQQEKDVFGQIADSRAKLAGAKTPEQTIDAANQQSAALSRLLVVVENYPQLRSNEQFGRLMDELSGTENRIAVERMRYNMDIPNLNGGQWQFGSLANFLTNRPTTFGANFEGSTARRGLRQTMVAGYVQDDIRYRSNLSFNLGCVTNS